MCAVRNPKSKGVPSDENSMAAPSLTPQHNLAAQAQARAASDAYLRDKVMNTPREELPLLCFDGALRFLDQAKLLVDDRTPTGIQSFGQKIQRVQAIIRDLNTALDMEKGGELADSLRAQYHFLNSHLIGALIDRDAQKLADATAIITNLREGWAGALEKIRAENSAQG